MKSRLHLVAVLILLATVGFWLASGANRGWSKTSVPRKTLDDVTGIEGITYDRQFVPGLDFLGAGIFGAAFLTGVSFLFKNNHQVKPSSTKQYTNQ